jgi:hypothetical protein
MPTNNKQAGKAAQDGEKQKVDRKTSDWERIEIDFRAGVLSVREIGAKHGLSHTAINKRAKAEGWDRDLNAKVKARADAMVAKREVSAMVATEKVETERQVVEASAQVIANVRMGHRDDIRRFRRLAMALLSELEAETGDPALFEELGEMLRAEDDKGRDARNDIYRKVISSVGRIDSMKKLADTLKTLIALEREAYGIVGAPESGKPQEQETGADVAPDEAYKRMLGQ